VASLGPEQDVLPRPVTDKGGLPVWGGVAPGPHVCRHLVNTSALGTTPIRDAPAHRTPRSPVADEGLARRTRRTITKSHIVECISPTVLITRSGAKLNRRRNSACRPVLKSDQIRMTTEKIRPRSANPKNLRAATFLR